MTTPTPKERVKKVFPDAYCFLDYRTHCYVVGANGIPLGHEGGNAKQAWSNAAANLKGGKKR